MRPSADRFGSRTVRKNGSCHEEIDRVTCGNLAGNHIFGKGFAVCFVCSAHICILKFRNIHQFYVFGKIGIFHIEFSASRKERRAHQKREHKRKYFFHRHNPFFTASYCRF